MYPKVLKENEGGGVQELLFHSIIDHDTHRYTPPTIPFKTLPPQQGLIPSWPILKQSLSSAPLAYKVPLSYTISSARLPLLSPSAQSPPVPIHPHPSLLFRPTPISSSTTSHPQPPFPTSHSSSPGALPSSEIPTLTPQYTMGSQIHQRRLVH